MAKKNGCSRPVHKFNSPNMDTFTSERFCFDAAKAQCVGKISQSRLEEALTLAQIHVG